MLSIIIPTYNEEKYLPLLLQSIKFQDYKDYEIIVSDADSEDATRKIAKKFGCKVVRGGLPAKGRNNGAKHAKGEILLFLDADVILPKGFLSENLDAFEKEKLVCASAWAKPISKNIFDKIFFFVAHVFHKIVHLVRPIGMGWCIFIRKSVFKEINGFNEKLLVGEDYDLVNKTHKYKRFRMLSKKKVYVSVRRYEKEGRLRLIPKILKATFYDLAGKKMTVKNRLVDYKFGGYDLVKAKLPKKIR
jgi:glycosyltransferase involved in cell wall biosynthesis